LIGGGDGVTATFTWQYAVPPGPEAVPLKMVSAIRIEVVTEPPATGATLPMRLSIEKAVELAVVQESVEKLLAIIIAGFAESVHVGGEGGTVTVTVTAHFVEPLGPVATPSYEVVTVGDTVFDPDATGVTVPTPLPTESVVAFVVVQESFEEPPMVIEAGLAERVQVGAEGGGGGFASVQEAVAPLFTPVHSHVYLLELSVLFELVPALQS